ncbi:MAG TPA: hypothetical protein VJ716_08605 [Gaiellaceae bacterium]|nr:hypothetical protein [Gaiellaceae bacterium]
MKALSLRLIAAAAVFAVVFVPAAAGKSSVRVKLSVLPLTKSAIGPAAKSLPLERAGSGVLANGGRSGIGKIDFAGMAVTPNHSFGHTLPSTQYLEKLGRISGYVLDYGLGASGGAGVTEVRTGVDEYKTRADAKKGLALWKRLDPTIDIWVGNGLSVSVTKERVAAVGGSRFAFLVGYSDANIAPLYGVDEQFTQGRYEADVTVWAGSAAAAQRLAPILAKKLDVRIKRALAGKLHAKPVELTPRQKPGPPSGGPDLSRLALQTSDVPGPATAFVHSYVAGSPLSSFTVSEYWANFIPAGPFNFLEQQIQWFATANQASFQADFDAAFLDRYQHPLDLSSLGDGARGAVENRGSEDNTGYATLVFSSGPLEELVVFASDNPIQPSDAQSIAQRVANYINAAGLGS